MTQKYIVNRLNDGAPTGEFCIVTAADEAAAIARTEQLMAVIPVDEPSYEVSDDVEMMQP